MEKRNIEKELCNALCNTFDKFEVSLQQALETLVAIQSAIIVNETMYCREIAKELTEAVCKTLSQAVDVALSEHEALAAGFRD